MKIDKQKILSRIEKFTRMQKIMLQVFILFAICGGSWFFYLGPALDKIKTLNSEVESLEDDITNFSLLIVKIPALKKEFQDREKELILARTLLPEDASALERLLASFEQLGNEKGVFFLLFQPGSEELSQYYASRQVQLRLQGRFHDLMGYFDELSRLDRLVSISSLRLTPQRNDQPGNLTAETVLSVYRSLSDHEQQEKSQ
ncbi:MAG: type 4a pilus biogenesis protein PilO [Desulfonatronovibrio sp.]